MQYVYKQGGQTVLIDYPMSEDTYSKLKHTANNTSNNTVVVKQSVGGQNTGGGGTVTVSQPPKILMSTSVDTLANSLISQITTPVNVATPTPGSVGANGSSSETVTGMFIARSSKGQLISELDYKIIVSPKIRTKNCQEICPHYTG